MTRTLCSCLASVFLMLGCTPGTSVVLSHSGGSVAQIIPRPPAIEDVKVGDTWRSTVLDATSLIPTNPRFRCVESCPDGLTVDVNSGKIEWTIAPSYAGMSLKIVFAFVAADAERTVDFQLRVAPSAAAPLATPSPTPPPGTAGEPLRLRFWQGSQQFSGDSVVLDDALESQPWEFLAEAYGGAPPYRFRCVSGCPEGFSLHAATGLSGWTPGFDAAGPQSMAVEAVDSEGTSVQSSVQWEVQNKRRPLTFAAVSPQSVAEGSPLVVALNAQSPDGGAVDFACLAPCPSGVRFEGSPKRLEWTPDFNQAGTHALSLLAFSGADTASQLVSVQVSNTVRLPSFQVTQPTLTSGSYDSGVSAQRLSGSCSLRPLILTAVFTPDQAFELENLCSTEGRWSLSFTASASVSIALRAVGGFDSADARNLAVSLNWTPAVPAVAIGNSMLEGKIYTPLQQLALQGTCSVNAATLAVLPDVGFVDGDCSDGTWQTNPISLNDVRVTVSVTARTAAGVSRTAQTQIVPHFVLGQTASDVVGNVERALSSSLGGAWTDGTRLAVADAYNNRVLLWNSLPSSGTFSPDIVLGQSSLSARSVNEGSLPSSASLSNPKSVFFAGNRLFVADMANHRVLVWNGWPTQNHAPAQFVLGQVGFSLGSANPAGVNASSLNNPHGLWADANRLVVTEYSGHRALIWDLTAPLSNGRSADLVLGQADFQNGTANAAFDAVGSRQLNTPSGVFSDGTRLWITDEGNQRVLQWSTFPTSNGQAADVVLGQADFVGRTSNAGGRSSATLFNPRGVVWCGGRLFVADMLNNRILGWNGVPVSHGQAADLVLGQADFTSVQAHPRLPTASNVGLPHTPSCANDRLYVSDYDNGRLLWWDGASTLSSSAAANGQVGRPDFTTGMVGAGELNLSLSSANGGIRVGESFVLADFAGNRVLIWNHLPTSLLDLPQVVIGQRHLDEKLANAEGVSARSLSGPVKLATDGQKLAICDYYNSRILIFNSLPTSSFAAADIILGQPDAVTVSFGTTSSKMRNPDGLSFTQDHLIVADRSNHRVLVWNLKNGDGSPNPLTTGRAADLVLGQASFGPVSANRGGAIALSTLNTPLGAAEFSYVDSGLVARTGLAVADYGNNRVVLWRDFPTVNGEAATYVLGQANATSGVANTDGFVSALGMYSPVDVAADATRLVVSDSANNRVLIWNGIPEASSVLPQRVLGQGNFSSAGANWGLDSTMQGFYRTRNLFLGADGSLIVGQISGVAVKVWSKIPSFNGAPADAIVSTLTRSVTKLTVNSQGLAPTSSVVVDGKLLVADAASHRLLSWNSRPTAHGVAASAVWGQADFSGAHRNRSLETALPTASSLSNPRAIATGGGKFFVTDSYNNRILIFDSFPSGSAAPSSVLGQLDLVSSMPNRGGISGRTLNTPMGISTDGLRFAAVDQLNHRVLLWDSLTGEMGQAAHRVLGQPSLFENAPNRNGGVDATTLFSPGEVLLAEGKLIVSDAGNNRILIWNSWPLSNAQPADVVLGQGGFGTNAANASDNPAKNLSAPRDLLFAHGRFYAVDRANSRILFWNGIPTQNQTPADGVIGKAGLSDVMPSTSLGPERFLNLRGLTAWGNLLVVSDIDGFRVSAFAVP